MTEVEEYPIFELKDNYIYLSEGSFAEVYKISPRRIIKIYMEEYFEDGMLYAQDEVDGVKYFRNGLPVIKTVAVFYERSWRAANIKRYIPNPITEYELDQYAKRKADFFDCGIDQYRKDNKGTIYRVDTQYKLVKKIIVDYDKEVACEYFEL